MPNYVHLVFHPRKAEYDTVVGWHAHGFACHLAFLCVTSGSHSKSKRRSGNSTGWFEAEFDIEHGLGVLTDGNRILGTGYQTSVTPYFKEQFRKKSRS